MTRTRTSGIASIMRARVWPLAAACLLVGLLPCAAAQATAAQQVHATQAWIRVLPGALPAGAYVTLRSGGDQAVELAGAKSSSYG